VCKKFGNFSESLAAIYMTQVLIGLQYLHEQGELECTQEEETCSCETHDQVVVPFNPRARHSSDLLHCSALGHMCFY
jgi:serine/threonine protein kinase